MNSSSWFSFLTQSGHPPAYCVDFLYPLLYAISNAVIAWFGPNPDSTSITSSFDGFGTLYFDRNSSSSNIHAVFKSDNGMFTDPGIVPISTCSGLLTSITMQL